MLCGAGRQDQQEWNDQSICMFGASTQALREISLLRMLEHGNIVPLLDVFTEPGLLYMVFPYLDRDLAHHLQDVGKLPKASLLRYSFQLLSALAYCHSRCIVHRDIKPQNILVELQTEEVKLCDFSLSRRSLLIRMEKYTQKVASLWYRGPEIFLGAESKGTFLDVWSTACVVAEMAKAKPLFSESSEIGMLFRQFEVLGTPSNATWPGVTGLPYWSDVFPHFCKRNLQDVLKLEASIINLLEQMLQCNPFERLSASVLLTHPCFFDINKCPSTVVQRHTSASEKIEKHSEPSFTRAVQRIVEDQSPKKNSFVKNDTKQYPRPYSPETFGQGSQKRFKSTSNEADVQNPLSLREEWTRSTQSSSFLSQISL